jgi:hypothetical protein
MLEERHPAFAGRLLVIKRRESSFFRNTLVVSVLRGKRD